MSNIRVPVMPEPAQVSFITDSVNRHCRIKSYTSAQLAALNAEWLEKVGPVVEALERISGYSMSQFKNAADMAAQCVDDAAKAHAASTQYLTRGNKDMNNKRGALVAVCHDGKWSRRVIGEVIHNDHGRKLLIRFIPGGLTEPITFWAKRRPAIRYGAQKRGSVISHGKRPVSYGGWADAEIFCPWFSVYAWPRKDQTEILKGHKT